MTEEQFEARKEEIMDEAFDKLSEELLNEFDDETRSAIVMQVIVEGCNREAAKDPEFKEVYIRRVASSHIRCFFEDRLPTGAYREDAWIPLDGDGPNGTPNRVKQMPRATSKDLLAWQALETDPANLAYIESRLNAWKPEHQTLADLEKMFRTSPNLSDFGMSTADIEHSPENGGPGVAWFKWSAAPGRQGEISLLQDREHGPSRIPRSSGTRVPPAWSQSFETKPTSAQSSPGHDRCVG
jgi:hypothetical protein